MIDYKEKFEKMRVAGNLAARTLDMLTENIKEGISTDYIDKLGYEFIRDNGGYSAPLYYRGFTKSLCTSLNHVVCHGIPSEDRILEEGDAVNGTKKVVDYLKKKKEKINFCLVGEPTNPNKLGEMIKIGRRGSLTGKLTIFGVQGHVAYPQRANNPSTTIVKILNEIKEFKFDKGNKNFQPTNLAFGQI